MNPGLRLLVSLNKIKSVKSIAYLSNSVQLLAFHQKFPQVYQGSFSVFSGLCCKPAILGLSKQHGSLKNRFEFSPGRVDPYLDINLKDSELCILSKTM